jgi:protein transport protein SEC31
VSGTLGETFETTAALELLRWEPAERKLELVGGTVAPDRFHALAWGKHGPSEMGLIAGGLTNGVVSVWDPATFHQDDKGPVASASKHAGAVQGLDWNPTMTNLLASCGSDGQLLIWDLANAGKPSVYVPGARVKPVADGMTTVAWNKTATVPHILAGALSNGSCEIWDLKNKKQVIAFHDAKRCPRGGQRSLAWHPSEPTMIVQASDDDASPVLLLWDLKHYAAPVAVLSGHKRGVACVSWSAEDPSLVITSSRDGTSLVWDLPAGQVRSQLAPAASSVASGVATETPHHTQVAFAPLIRGHVATASSDGLVRMHALVDAGPRGRPAAGRSLGPAPQWLKRPCGASFGFGGRLLRFSAASRAVRIAAVVTDSELVEEARRLKTQSATGGDLAALCEQKGAEKGPEQPVWALLAARLNGADRKGALLTAIGADKEASPPKEEENPFDSLSGASTEWGGAEAPLWGAADWEARAGRLACAGDVRGAWRACAEAGEWASALVMARELGGESEYVVCRAQWQSASSGAAPALVSGIVRALAGPPERLAAEGPLDEWRALAAAALAWGGERSSRLLSVLGARLSAAGNVAAAQLCWIGADDLDALAATWAHESNTETVRRLLCASRAFGTQLAPHNSRLAHHLGQLADALAAQGDMEGALYWLEQIQQPASAPPHIRLLYERLRAAKAPSPPASAPKGLQAGQQRPAAVSAASAVPLPSASASVRPIASPGAVAASPIARPSVPTPSVYSPASFPVPVAILTPPSVSSPHPTPHVQVAAPSVHLPPAPTFVSAAMPHAPAPAESHHDQAARAPAAALSPSHAAIASVCEQLSRVAEELGGSSEQCLKLADEVAKRVPPLKSKLDSLPAGTADGLVAVLQQLASAMEARDAGRAQQAYAEAQHHHVHLGSTGMLGLKRMLELVQKSSK